MRLNLSDFQRLFVLILLVSSCFTLVVYLTRSKSKNEYIIVQELIQSNEKLTPIISIKEEKDINEFCFQSNDINHRYLQSDYCLHYKRIQTIIWTYHATGILKYIQWIRTRKLASIRIIKLDNHCLIDRTNEYMINSNNDIFIQIYILSFSSIFDTTSRCSFDINSIVKYSLKYKKHIYFKRKSLNATIGYDHLDTNKDSQNLTFNWNEYLKNNFQKTNQTMNYFTNLFLNFPSNQLIILNIEEFISSDLILCENILKEFLQNLTIDTTKSSVKKIIEYDSHHFVLDASWWDQSSTIENLISSKIPSRSETFSYENDFYYFHGNYSFGRYLYDTRQCFRQGIFAQMQDETIRNRASTDQPERCLQKQFDCSFSDIYSLNDREELYQKYDQNQDFSLKTIKCGFAIPSVIDKVRKKYGRNQTCQTVVLTSISNCYDPLPRIEDRIPPSTCLVALLDTRTYKALRQYNVNSPWDLIDLGNSGELFRVPAKITETLKLVGHRMFPLAKWIVWLDGKAYIINIQEILNIAVTPAIGLHHSDFSRTSQNEVNLTINRVITGEPTTNSTRLQISLLEISLQEKQYEKEGFYSRSNQIGLPLFDIAIFIYRINHPCIYRYLCGWHNEINYFSYRGQLSVYYPAERLNLYTYLGFIPRKFYHTMAHMPSC